jgi:hypothetical protein
MDSTRPEIRAAMGTSFRLGSRLLGIPLGKPLRRAGLNLLQTFNGPAQEKKENALGLSVIANHRTSNHFS